MSSSGFRFQQLGWDLSVVGNATFQQEEKALVPLDTVLPETRYSAFIKKDTS